MDKRVDVAAPLVGPATPGTSSRGVAIRLEGLSKSFGSIPAVADVTLGIPAGQFVTLLGPSGSGKTTTLNLIAGFITPDTGEIFFDDRPVSQVPAHRRDIGMVFQSYALFPHMTVFDNVAFPLRMRTKLSGQQLRTRVEETLELVHLSGFEKRYPRQLSGGQQQRVSMARALVSQPRLLLMDEPLGALDKRLRDQMLIEIKRIHRSVGSTFVYVTHDQSEALTMSDLVVVMNNSRIAESGPPRSLYETPKTEFVADFLGAANFLSGIVCELRNGAVKVEIPGSHTIGVEQQDHQLHPGDRVRVALRPEDLCVSLCRPADQDDCALPCRVVESAYLGDVTKIVVSVEAFSLSCKVNSRTATFPPDSAAWVYWPRSSARLIRSGGHGDDR